MLPDYFLDHTPQMHCVIQKQLGNVRLSGDVIWLIYTQEDWYKG